jgi:hypothetical protein
MVLVGRIIEGYVRVAANLMREVEDDVPDAVEEEGKWQSINRKA